MATLSLLCPARVAGGCEPAHWPCAGTCGGGDCASMHCTLVVTNQGYTAYVRGIWVSTSSTSVHLAHGRASFYANQATCGLHQRHDLIQPANACATWSLCVGCAAFRQVRQPWPRSVAAGRRVLAADLRSCKGKGTLLSAILPGPVVHQRTQNLGLCTNARNRMKAGVLAEWSSGVFANCSNVLAYSCCSAAMV